MGHTDIQGTHRQTGDTHTDRGHTGRQGTHIQTETHRQTGDTHTYRDTQTDRGHTHKQGTHRQTRDTQTGRDTQTDRDTHTYSGHTYRQAWPDRVQYKLCVSYKCVCEQHRIFFSDCYTNSTTYTGTTNITYNGIPCQRWDVTWPHNPYPREHIENLPDPTISDAANYCRDPDGTGAPWCLTIESGIRWQYCGVSRCYYLGM
jgi:hypothetical protein